MYPFIDGGKGDEMHRERCGYHPRYSCSIIYQEPLYMVMPLLVYGYALTGRVIVTC